MPENAAVGHRAADLVGETGTDEKPFPGTGTRLDSSRSHAHHQAPALLRSRGIQTSSWAQSG